MGILPCRGLVVAVAGLVVDGLSMARGQVRHDVVVHRLDPESHTAHCEAAAVKQTLRRASHHKAGKDRQRRASKARRGSDPIHSPRARTKKDRRGSLVGHGSMEVGLVTPLVGGARRPSFGERARDSRHLGGFASQPVASWPSPVAEFPVMGGLDTATFCGGSMSKSASESHALNQKSQHNTAHSTRSDSELMPPPPSVPTQQTPHRVALTRISGSGDAAASAAASAAVGVRPLAVAADLGQGHNALTPRTRRVQQFAAKNAGQPGGAPVQVMLPRGALHSANR
jgi:hypothetical protein